MQVSETELPGILLLKPTRYTDSRGMFVETWNRDAFRACGIDAAFVQDNLSVSTLPGTVRGLHYQRPPTAQAKLVQVVKGRVLDVVVDLRRQSASYGRHLALELSSADGALLFIPAGFAHGFCTLEPDVVFTYKVDAYYSHEHESAIHWRDPDLAIAWPIESAQASLSAKDSAAGRFSEVDHGF